MLGNVMPVHGVQNCICLQPRVDCFMPTLHPLLKSISLRRTAQHCSRYLSPEWALSPVPIISLNSFKWIQPRPEGFAEDLEIVQLPRLVGSTHPADVPSLYPQGNFIPKTGPSELVQAPIGASLGDRNISSINRHQAIIASVTLVSVVEFNLKSS